MPLRRPPKPPAIVSSRSRRGPGASLLALGFGAAMSLGFAMRPAPVRAQSADELRDQVRGLTEQVRRLNAELERLRQRTDQLDDRTDALATQQEQAGQRPAPDTAGRAAAGARPSAAAGAVDAGAGAGAGAGGAAAGGVPATSSGHRDPGDQALSASGLIPGTLDSSVGRASLFGYGELNYNRYSRDASQSRATVRRAVLGFGYRFSDRLRLVSEYEWENAVVSADDPGESEVEQLYLDYSVNRALNIKAGLFLMPIGILNEMHEPTYYYGVERNDVESRVIPTTWRELGLGVHGALNNGLYYDVGLTTGFNMAKWTPTEGPQAPLAAIHGEGAQAYAGSGAVYAALRYNVPGLRIGGGIWSGDSSQRNGMFRAGESTIDMAGINGRVTLWDLHAIWQPGRWDVRALYTRGTIGNAGRLDDVLAGPAVGQTTGFVPSAFDGWYVQGAYALWRSGDFDLRPFGRYERYDLQSRMPAGYGSFSDPLLRDRVITVGLSLFVARNAVVKSDYQWYQNDRNRNRFNLGLGFAF